MICVTIIIILIPHILWTWLFIFVLLVSNFNCCSRCKCAGTTKKKTHPWHFDPNNFFFCHTYDTSMTIIVTKPGIIINVVGSYLYDKKSSSGAGRRRSCMTFFGLSMTGKTVVEARGRKISGSSRLRWEVGGERCAFLLYTYARVCGALALTEPDRGVGL